MTFLIFFEKESLSYGVSTAYQPVISNDHRKSSLISASSLSFFDGGRIRDREDSRRFASSTEVEDASRDETAVARGSDDQRGPTIKKVIRVQAGLHRHYLRRQGQGKVSH